MSLRLNSKRTARLAAQYPVYDFLAPTLLQIPRTRCLSTTTSTRTAATSQSSQNQNPQSSTAASSEPKPAKKPLSQAQRDFLDKAV